MFKNIQKYLLINQPLLWNLKIVPLMAFLLFFNSAFFILGYLNGGIDFTETESNYNYNTNEGIILFFGALIAVLTAIVWGVFYFKNNALKSNYPKSKYSLFTEWMLILMASFFLCSYTIVYFAGKDTKVRSYYSETEAKKRCETLSIGSFFTSSSYGSTYYDENAEPYFEVDSAATDIKSEKRYFKFEGKNYKLNSLVNNNISNFRFFDRSADSLRNIKVRHWLVNEQKDSIKNVLKNYLKIVKEHHLSTSIDENKWLSLVYFPKSFEKFVRIAGQEHEDYYNENQTQTIDSTQYIKQIGSVKFLYNKYYVPVAAMQYNYDKIATSYVSPNIESDSILICFYFGLAISLVIFSFRVTSFKSLLIAGVSCGVLAIIVGIISAIFSNEFIAEGSVIALFLILTTYFFIVLKRKKGKSLTEITINAMLWLLPSFAPLVFILTLEISKIVSGYKTYIEKMQGNTLNQAFPKIYYFDEMRINILYVNVIFTIVILFFFSIKIKQWRGMAEN